MSTQKIIVIGCEDDLIIGTGHIDYPWLVEPEGQECIKKTMLAYCVHCEQIGKLVHKGNYEE